MHSYLNSFLLGAVGVEMAAELKLIHPAVNVTLVHSKDQLVSSEPLPDEFKFQVLCALKQEGVNVVLGRRVLKTCSTIINGQEVNTLYLNDGSRLCASVVINAVSQGIPNTTYLPSSSLDSDGYVITD